MQYKKPLLLAVSVLFLTGPVSSSYAWGWGLPIKPGDHVIDVKRLQDSIKETAEQVKVYLNEVTKWKNKMLLMSGVTGLDERIDKAIDRYSKAYAGQGLLNTSVPLSSLAAKQRIDGNILANPAAYKQNLYADQQQSHLDTVTAMTHVSNRSAERLQLAGEVLNQQTDGYVGTVQQTSALHQLQLLNDEDEARAYAAMLLQDITNDETKFAEERLAQAEAKQQEWYGYSPYHPSEYDKDHAPQTENFGFLSTKYLGE